MDLNIENKVFLVTGGGSGIGKAISLKIAEEGGIPVIVGRDKEAGDEVVDQITSTGGKAIAIEKELAGPNSCKEVVEECLEHVDSLHGLVNNAGQNDRIGLETGTPEAWLQSLDKNLHHYFYLAHYTLPQLKKTKGCIVNISSKTALTGQGYTSAYCAAKGAQLALTREWAVELLKYSIRVNAVLPAEVKTPLYESWLKNFQNPDEKLEQIESKIPLEQRMTWPEEIADTVVFLLSNRASHITGQFLFVDGGYVHLDRSAHLLNT